MSDVIAQAEQLHPEYGRNTSVYYLGLPKAFIAGAIFCSQNGDCVEGARVLLIKESGEEVLIAATNNYGDFEFEGVERGSMYSLKIEPEGYDAVTIEGICTEKDVYLGDISLQKGLV